MRPVKTLPEGYELVGTLNLSKGTWILVAMQVAALVLFFAAAWLFVSLAVVLSRIVGPVRAHLYWGAGEDAGRVAGRIRHPGRFVMLIPRELDMVAAGRHTNGIRE